MHAIKKKFNKNSLSFLDFKKKKSQETAERTNSKTDKGAGKKSNLNFVRNTRRKPNIDFQDKLRNLYTSKNDSKIQDKGPKKPKNKKLNSKNETCKKDLKKSISISKYNADVADSLKGGLKSSNKNNENSNEAKNKNPRDASQRFLGALKTPVEARNLPKKTIGNKKKNNNRHLGINLKKKKRNTIFFKNWDQENSILNLQIKPKKNSGLQKNKKPAPPLREEVLIPGEGRANFFKDMSDLRGELHPHTLTKNMIQKHNQSTGVNNLQANLNPPLDEEKLEFEIDFIIRHIESEFESYLKGKVIRDGDFAVIKAQIADFFGDANPESWRLAFETAPQFYRVRRKLGTSAGRNYYLVRQVLTGADVVIENVLKSEESLDKVRREVSILKAMQPNEAVARFYEHFEDRFHSYLVFENLQAQGFESLKAFLQDPTILDHQNLAGSVCYGLLKAVEYVHSCGIVHRNLSLQNVHYDGKQRVKISGFSNSAVKGQKRSIEPKFVREFEWVAPELKKEPALSDFKSDVWACGKILETLAETWGPANTIPRDLVFKMLEEDVSVRPSLREVLQHPFFRELETETKLREERLGNESTYNFPHYKAKNTTAGPSCLFTPEKEDRFEEGPGNMEKGETCPEGAEPEKDRPSGLKEPREVDKLKFNEIFEETKQKILVLLCLEHLRDCGFPVEFLRETLESGQARGFSHLGACTNILIKAFTVHSQYPV